MDIRNNMQARKISFIVQTRNTLPYLELAYKCIKPKEGVIHLYIIEPESEVEEKVKELMKKFQKKTKAKINYQVRRVLPYSPRTYKYCVDIQIKGS